MNVYEYLRQIKKYDYRIKCAKEEIERLSNSLEIDEETGFIFTTLIDNNKKIIPIAILKHKLVAKTEILKSSSVPNATLKYEDNTATRMIAT